MANDERTNKQTNKQQGRRKKGDIGCPLCVRGFIRRDLDFAPHHFLRHRLHRACRIYWTIEAREVPVESVINSALHLLYSSPHLVVLSVWLLHWRRTSISDRSSANRRVTVVEFGMEAHCWSCYSMDVRGCSGHSIPDCDHRDHYDERVHDPDLDRQRSSSLPRSDRSYLGLIDYDGCIYLDDRIHYRAEMDHCNDLDHDHLHDGDDHHRSVFDYRHRTVGLLRYRRRRRMIDRRGCV